jgi:hypothetical protein
MPSDFVVNSGLNMVAARGAEESTAWRPPTDPIALCQTATSSQACSRPVEAGTAGRIMRRSPERFLGDDPISIMDALKAAVRSGALPATSAAPLACAAALSIARFGSARSNCQIFDPAQTQYNERCCHLGIEVKGGPHAVLRLTRNRPEIMLADANRATCFGLSPRSRTES